MTQGEIEGVPLPFQQAMGNLESRIMSDIVRRIRINGSVTASAEWQYDRLRQLGESEAYIRSQVQVMLGVTDKEVGRLFSGMVPEAGGELEALIQAVTEQTKNTFRNLSASLGFAIRGPDRRIYHTGLLDYYQDTLDAAILDIGSGAFSYDTILKRTISQMTNSGLRWIDYDTGHHNRVDVAARRAVMTGYNQIQAKINEQTARRLGTDYFEVSYHRGARPEHQVWQGRVYSSVELRSVCGLGSVTGLCGANCYHWYDAFVPGVSVRTYTDEQLDRMMEEENTPREYDGKEYTVYEALQHQRRLETLMRKQREDIRLLKEGDAEEDTILAAASRYRSSMAQYVDFSEAMDLPQQMERVYYDGLRRVISGRQGIDKSSKNVIMKSKILSTKEVVEKAKWLSEELVQGKEELNYKCDSPIFEYIVRKLKYDSNPKIVVSEDFLLKVKDSPVGIIYRGIAGDSQEQVDEYIKAFKDGKIFIGKRSAYGHGMYFSPDEKVAANYAQKKNYTGIIKAILSQDAQVGDYKELLMEYSSTGADKAGHRKNSNTESWEYILSTVGEFASVKGYDAIAMNGFNGNFHIIVLNRGKVIVEK